MPEAEVRVPRSGSPRRVFPWTLLLAITVVAAGWLLYGHGANSRADTDSAGSPVLWTLHLDPFVLNLADPEERAYLRVGIDLGLGGEKKDSAMLPMGMLRDTILGELAQCKAKELLTPQGKAQLKDDLLLALRRRVPTLGVEEVYFTELLIQR